MNVIFTKQIRKYFLTVNSQQTSMLSSLYILVVEGRGRVTKEEEEYGWEGR